jgi:hypothetical protein
MSSPFSLARLAGGVTLAVVSMAASGGAALALLNHGANFDVTVPVTAVVPVGVCAAQSVGTSNNVNRGEEFDHNDSQASSDSESNCAVANHIAENVHDVLNENNSGNVNENFSDNLNHSLNHNNNNNIREIGERGALITL